MRTFEYALLTVLGAIAAIWLAVSIAGAVSEAFARTAATIEARQ